jgi:hypothetical protein
MAIHIHLNAASKKTRDFDFEKAPFYILKNDTSFPMKLGWVSKSNMADPNQFYVRNSTVFYQVKRGYFVPHFKKQGTPFPMSEGQFLKQTRDAKRTKADINEELSDVLEMLKEAEHDGSSASEVRSLEREVAKLRAELQKTGDAQFNKTTHPLEIGTHVKGEGKVGTIVALSYQGSIPTYMVKWDTGGKWEAPVTKFTKDATNHLGEKQYNSYSAWRVACKNANPSVQFEGDKDICNAKPGV